MFSEFLSCLVNMINFQNAILDILIILLGLTESENDKRYIDNVAKGHRGSLMWILFRDVTVMVL